MSSISHPAPARRGKQRSEVIPAGTKFGRLTVIHGPFRQPPPARAVYFYHCRCECGRARDFRRSNLASGCTASCGCLNRDNRTKHGESHSRLYCIWECIIQRCHNPKQRKYADYGGRGIYVCGEWRTGYLSFRDWALANGYADNLEIDRKNNDGPYSPDNCDWATRKTQTRNTRRNNNLTAFGETKCKTDWIADPRCLVSDNCLRYRINKGWTIEAALTTPPLPKGQRHLSMPFA